MGLRAEFDAAAISIFDAFGDLIEDVTHTKPGAWDIVTETQTPASTETIRVALREYTRAEQFSARGANAGNVDVMSGDLQGLVIQSEMTATPEIDDTLLLDGVTYLVRSIGNISKILWRLQLRRV